MAPLFAFDGLTVRRGTATLIEQVDVAVPGRGVTVVVGSSGAGKSTLLRCCNRLEAPTEGTVHLWGTDIATVDPLALRRRVGMIFQAPTTFPGTVLDNLRVARPDLTETDGVGLLERCGLVGAMAHRLADSLSGGEAQRMVLARALTTGPEALLADEPTSALDAVATRRLEDLARAIAEDGVPLVWVTHDLDQMRRLADHLVVMALGRVTWTGAPDDPRAKTAVDDALRSSP